MEKGDSPVEAPARKLSVEKVTLLFSFVTLVGTGINGCYVFIAHKEFAEADKAREELLLLKYREIPRADVSASRLPATQDPYYGHRDLCTVTGIYELKNTGDPAIKIDRLLVNVYELELGEPLADDKKIAKISFNTRIQATKPLVSESLPDSSGIVQSGEKYSRSYGYIIRRDPAKQYAIEVSPQPADQSFTPNAFRAWSDLSGICNPVPKPTDAAPSPQTNAPAPNGNQ